MSPARKSGPPTMDTTQAGATMLTEFTATLVTSDGETWRVPFHVLRHVLDV